MTQLESVIQSQEKNLDAHILPSLKDVMTSANIEFVLPSTISKVTALSTARINDQSSASSAANSLLSDTQCQHCNKSFKNVHAKKKHQSSVHGPKLPCDYCGKKLKVFGRSDLMKQHLDRCKRYKSFLEEQQINANKY